MQFYFIRHAQSENNRLWGLTGSHAGRSEDPDLTAVGREQAARLAEFLRQPGRSPVYGSTDSDTQNVNGFAFTHLYCSLMVRSVATATIVAQALDLPLVAWEDLHEIGGMHQKDPATGAHEGFPGKNRSFFETHYPRLVLPESLGEEGWWNRPYEERAQRPSRARRVGDELLTRHGDSDDRVAVISHGGFFNYLLSAILNLPGEGGSWFSMNNAAITRIDFGRSWILLQYLNRVDFLPRELIT
jgi:2,3-bisphosphoglycerate-dependent phosphoglycerate mutase